MQVAHAAIVRATGGIGHHRVVQAAVVAKGPLLHLQVQSGIGEDNIPEVAVVLAALLHDHFAAFFKYPGINELRALGA